MKKLQLLAGAAMMAVAVATIPAYAAEAPLIGLITKTNTNPYFVKMKAGFEAQAKKDGLRAQSFAGKADGDSDSQITAIENLMAAHAKGILITASSSAVVPAIEKARKAGILVIALDSPLQPANAADATFATDNFLAGKLIGEWAHATMGAGAATAKIAMLDLATGNIPVDVLRDTGFLKGFGIAVKDPNKIGTESDKRIVGHEITAGAEDGGRKAMENLLQKDPGINLVYNINEPAAAGAYQALKAAGKKALIVAIDGSCDGVKNVKAGIIGATSMQFPLLMASLGVDAVAKFAKTGEKPKNSPGLSFFNTGTTLITDHPVKGVPSITSAEGLKKCWG